MVETAVAGIPPGKNPGRCVLPPASMIFGKGSAGIAPKGEGRLRRTGTLRKKLQAASAVEEAALGQRAVAGVAAKGGKIGTGESTAVEDNQRVHVPVGRMVVMGYVRSTCNFSRLGMCPVKSTYLDSPGSFLSP
jgi:hypothetical protein